MIGPMFQADLATLHKLGATQFEMKLRNLVFSEINRIAEKKADFESKSAATSQICEFVHTHIKSSIQERNRLDEVIDRLTGELAALRAQLAAAEQRIAELEQWQPVEDGFTYLCQCADCATFDPNYPTRWRWQLYINGNDIGICDPDNDEDDRHVELPPNLRLMQLTTFPTESAGV